MLQLYGYCTGKRVINTAVLAKLASSPTSSRRTHIAPALPSDAHGEVHLRLPSPFLRWKVKRLCLSRVGAFFGTVTLTGRNSQRAD